jgi:hypothetical protein
LPIYELAYNLHKFAYEVEAMPYDEFTKWQKYFEVRPLGWREDERTLKLLQVQGFKGEPSSVFASFAKLKKADDTNGLRSSTVFKLMSMATGGAPLSEFLGAR